MNILNSSNCFMLFYYTIVTCLLVTCAAAADVGLYVDVGVLVRLHLEVFYLGHLKNLYTNLYTPTRGIGNSYTGIISLPPRANVPAQRTWQTNAFAAVMGQDGDAAFYQITLNTCLRYAYLS